MQWLQLKARIDLDSSQRKAVNYIHLGPEIFGHFGQFLYTSNDTETTTFSNESITEDGNNHIHSHYF